ncbi:FecCD family ABC transporter permease [Actinotignum urinale]|uniref:FecCD family ABC transporter permease n=1 Tax=Actinotignum urinale TaxID=190146 RepID=UPI00370D2843
MSGVYVPAEPPHIRLGFRRRARKTAIWIAILFVSLIVTIVAGIIAGPVKIPVDACLNVLAHHLFGAELKEANALQVNSIVWNIRVPRVFLGLGVGAGLALGGLVLQAVVRNMLGDPYVLGINSGASCGAAASILFGIGAGMGNYALQGSAFVGAFVASILVFFIARTAGRLTSIRLLMSGVAIGYALSAVTSFLIFASASAEGARSVMFWLLGSLGLARWDGSLAVVLIVVLLALILLIIVGPHIDALTVGDETALTLGINPERFRAILLVISCLLVGVIVSMAGSIGFVGLIVPHFARRMVGGVHRHVVPVAAFIGAILLVWADILSRVLLSPQEIPIGIITAMVGAPFLLILVRRMGTVKEA